jgi:hypothetical protein
VTMIRQAVLTGIAAMTLLAGVAGAGETAVAKGAEAAPAMTAVRPEIYAPVTLSADLSSLTGRCSVCSSRPARSWTISTGGRLTAIAMHC